MACFSSLELISAATSSSAGFWGFNYLFCSWIAFSALLFDSSAMSWSSIFIWVPTLKAYLVDKRRLKPTLWIFSSLTELDEPDGSLSNELLDFKADDE